MASEDKWKQFVQSFKDTFLSNETEVETKVELAEEIEVKEEVVLAEEVKEEVVEESVEVKQENNEWELKYTELSAEVSGLKAMLMQLMEVINPSEKKDVPTELKEEVKEELSEVEKIVHSPEVEVEKKFNLNRNNKSNSTVKDRVYNALFK